MSFFPPVALIRKKHIIKHLHKSRAFSPRTAKTLKDAGVLNPHSLAQITEHLVFTGEIHRTPQGKYYM